jgi:hypothetical protein
MQGGITGSGIAVMRVCVGAMLGLLLAGCATAQPVAVAALSPPMAASPAGSMVPADVRRHVTQLRAALLHEVARSITDTADGDRAWIARAQSAAGPVVIDRTQLLVVVDRNPAVQELRIMLARPDAPWEVIGGSKVSTGQTGRRDYYITPVGAFAHTDGILDYRALGTFNENHIRGFGLKGMRVWDFGWQSAEKGWRADREAGDIRLLMHATDPDYLEQRLGRPASQGCVRIPAAMNRFLDRHGVLDADYERAARDNRGLAALLSRDREPTPLAGNLLVVVDSSRVE